MGTNAKNSVVDSQFKYASISLVLIYLVLFRKEILFVHYRVHGIRNLRIIDASVLPTSISGNPNSILVGMAVRGASMIIKDLLKNIPNN